MRIPKEKGSERAKGFAYVEFNSTISHRVSENTMKPVLSGKSKMHKTKA